MKRATLFGLIAFAGCATLHGYGPPSPKFAYSYGCSYDDIMAVRKARSGPTIPQVGWTACDVLGRYGEPAKVDMQQTTDGTSVSWWFPDPWTGMSSPKLVQLDQESRGWVVTYVGWSGS